MTVEAGQKQGYDLCDDSVIRSGETPPQDATLELQSVQHSQTQAIHSASGDRFLIIRCWQKVLSKLECNAKSRYRCHLDMVRPQDRLTPSRTAPSRSRAARKKWDETQALGRRIKPGTLNFERASRVWTSRLTIRTALISRLRQHRRVRRDGYICMLHAA